MGRRAVLFDVDGVLIHGWHTNPERRRRWDDFLQEDLGVDQKLFFEAFIEPIFKSEVLTGKMSIVSALEGALETIGYQGSPMTVLAYWLNRDSQLNYPLLARIKRLRLGGAANLYIATNQEPLRALYLWNTLGLQHLFDDIFFSARLGSVKPDPQFFTAIERRLGHLDEPPIHFDDDPAVVDAARARGWEAFVFNDAEDLAKAAWMADRLH
ncbi:HAD family hydrolase [Bauldia sp.]|uniref:HAD family hydrolase n=1 Tax=Bauldia sp. TaxID=2575872 RepID=UPI003BAD3346